LGRQPNGDGGAGVTGPRASHKVPRNEVPARGRPSAALRRLTVKSQLEELVWEKVDEATMQRVNANSLYTTRTQAWVGSRWFNVAVGLMVLVNAVVVGAKANFGASAPPGTPIPSYLRVLDVFFVVFFILELLVRMLGHGLRTYLCGKGWVWNWFDLAVVISAIIDEVVASSRDLSGIDSGFLRIVKVGRVLRLIRMIHLIQSLKSLVYLIMASMSYFVWTIALLLMMIYCFAVYFTELTSDAAFQSTAALNGNWTSIWNSALTLFKAITGGGDWEGFVEVFSAGDSGIVYIFVFSTYVCFANMVMLNLVTGVFVDGAQKIVAQEHEDHLVRVATRLFGRTGRNTVMNRGDFQDLLVRSFLDDWLKVCGFALPDADLFFELIDEDGNGTLTFEEFVRGCIRLRGGVKVADVALLHLKVSQQGLEAAKAYGEIGGAHREIKEALAALASELGQVKERLAERAVQVGREHAQPAGQPRPLTPLLN